MAWPPNVMPVDISAPAGLLESHVDQNPEIQKRSAVCISEIGLETCDEALRICDEYTTIQKDCSEGDGTTEPMICGEVNCMLKSMKQTSQDDEDEDHIAEDGRLICTMHRKTWEPLLYLIIIDSGASSSTLPRDWCGHVKTWQTAESRGGQTFTVANGDEIPNLGRKSVTLMTKEGSVRDMRFEVCDVTRALGSVSQICKAGHTVVFNPPGSKQGSYIQHIETGDRMWMIEKDGIYLLDVRIAPEQKQVANKKDFTWRGP